MPVANYASILLQEIHSLLINVCSNFLLWRVVFYEEQTTCGDWGRLAFTALLDSSHYFGVHLDSFCLSASKRNFCSLPSPYSLALLAIISWSWPNKRGYPTSSTLSLKPPPHKPCLWDAIDHRFGAADGQERCNKHAAKGLGGEGFPRVHVFCASVLAPQLLLTK